MTDAPKTWTIKSARTVYNNRWIMVREYQTVAPTGADALYGMVHLHNLALGVVPVFENGDTILVGQQRIASGKRLKQGQTCRPQSTSFRPP